MKAESRLVVVAALAALSACAPRPATPPPVVAVVPPPPPPLPPVEEASADWADAPLSAGEWRYQAVGGGTEARFGSAEAGLMLRCDPGRRQVALARGGAAQGTPLTVRTSSGTRAVPDGVTLPAADPILDAIAFSRGRFAVEAAGLPVLVVPASPEAARVVEDCRG